MDREKGINKVKAIVADMQEEVDEWKDYSDSELRGGLTCDCDWWYKTLQTLKSTLALLKAQEPRVMTLWEAIGIIDRPVYLERNVLMPDKSVNRQECWALVQATDDEHMIRIATPYGIEKWHVGAYSIGWRCWSSRPTDEQREAEKWK